jgi:hypothetical protein
VGGTIRDGGGGGGGDDDDDDNNNEYKTASPSSDVPINKHYQHESTVAHALTVFL